MPGSATTPGHTDARGIAPVRVAFRPFHSVGTRNLVSFAAQWLACALPYRRFARTLADTGARLGADADRYSFIAVDSHHLLLADFTGAHRGRDAGCPAPPAQIRTSPIKAYGSHLGW
jgi:hypothetical protein